MKLLSILICTIPQRKTLFQSLISDIQRQINAYSPERVEVIWDAAPKGSVTIGEKRNRLLRRAEGEYVVFVDDDDRLSANYVSTICRVLIESSPDCVGYNIACTFRDLSGRVVRTAKAKVSRVYDNWHENKDGFDYAQMIYHKNPVRKALALQALFPDVSHGEDYAYGKKLIPLLKTEIFIDEFLYQYLYTVEPGSPEQRYPPKK
jgi:hypothetical protein